MGGLRILTVFGFLLGLAGCFGSGGSAILGGATSASTSSSGSSGAGSGAGSAPQSGGSSGSTPAAKSYVISGRISQ